MNIIVVENGTVQNVFTEEGEDFIVLERGNMQDTTLREIQGKLICEAEELPEVDLNGGVIAKHRDLYAISHRGSYYVGQDKQTQNEKCIGDGADMFETRGKHIHAGTLLFQANLLMHLMAMHSDEW